MRGSICFEKWPDIQTICFPSSSFLPPPPQPFSSFVSLLFFGPPFVFLCISCASSFFFPFNPFQFRAGMSEEDFFKATDGPEPPVLLPARQQDAETLRRKVNQLVIKVLLPIEPGSSANTGHFWYFS